MICDEVEVAAVQRLSPSYVRVELGGPALADFGVDGPLHDQRIKLVLPGDDGRLPPLAGTGERWYDAWRALPEGARGHLRTYSVRRVHGTGAATRLVVDLVLHLDPGACGPGSRWAARARVGDRILVVVPRRGVASGGIEFAPGDAGRLLLVADETAVPAVCSILGGLPVHASGAAFLEVPHVADAQEIAHPDGVRVTWLPRGEAPVGALLQAAVLDHLGGAPGPLTGPVTAPVGEQGEQDPDVWETPTHSSSGEAPSPEPPAGPPGDLYAWVAGEAGVVTGLRRHLVRELGMDRRRVAFMGYWRRGVAMRS